MLKKTPQLVHRANRGAFLYIEKIRNLNVGIQARMAVLSLFMLCSSAVLIPTPQGASRIALAKRNLTRSLSQGISGAPSPGPRMAPPSFFSAYESSGIFIAEKVSYFPIEHFKSSKVIGALWNDKVCQIS